MNIETTKTTPEAEIRDLVDDWVKGLHAKDIKRVMAHYAADIVIRPGASTAIHGRGCAKEELRGMVSQFMRSDWLRDSRPQHHCER